MPLISIAPRAPLSTFSDRENSGRDNNFNLLRFGAATAVVLSHSILLTGDLENSAAWRIGYLAVNCFFVISGFLVCRSLTQRRSIPDYTKARLLRIFPALIVVVTLTVFIPGLVLSTLDVGEYLSDSDTWHYLVVNSLLVIGKIELTLPGLFLSNPLPGQVNTPLWTLQYELIMYASLPAIWGLCRLLSGTQSALARSFKLIIIALTTVLTIAYINNVASRVPVISDFHHLLRFGAMFGAGASYYLLRQRIPLSALVACGLILITTLLQPLRPLFVTTTYLVLPYLLLCFAYLPGGSLRSFNRLGDYSYGIYIIAFPVQQSLIHLMPTLQPALLFTLSMSITLPLSALSWHLVERPALQFKPRLNHGLRDRVRTPAP